MRTICDVGAVNLVEAIVSMAAHDLEWSLKKRKPGEPEERMQRECERFFRSAYFTRLTGLDGKLVLQELHEQLALHQMGYRTDKESQFTRKRWTAPERGNKQ